MILGAALNIEPFANPALVFPEKYCPSESWNLMDKEKKKSNSIALKYFHCFEIQIDLTEICEYCLYEIIMFLSSYL